VTTIGAVAQDQRVRVHTLRKTAPRLVELLRNRPCGDAAELRGADRPRIIEQAAWPQPLDQIACAYSGRPAIRSSAHDRSNRVEDQVESLSDLRAGMRARTRRGEVGVLHGQFERPSRSPARNRQWRERKAIRGRATPRSGSASQSVADAVAAGIPVHPIGGHGRSRHCVIRSAGITKSVLVSACLPWSNRRINACGGQRWPRHQQKIALFASDIELPLRFVGDRNSVITRRPRTGNRGYEDARLAGPTAAGLECEGRAAARPSTRAAQHGRQQPLASPASGSNAAISTNVRKFDESGTSALTSESGLSRNASWGAPCRGSDRPEAYPRSRETRRLRLRVCRTAARDCVLAFPDRGKVAAGFPDRGGKRA